MGHPTASNKDEEMAATATSATTKTSMSASSTPDATAYRPSDKDDAEKRLVRKIDLYFMPILFFMYILNYVDRTNIVRSVSLHQ